MNIQPNVLVSRLVKETSSPIKIPHGADPGSWYVAYVRAAQEKAAAASLRSLGFRSYLPLYKAELTSCPAVQVQKSLANHWGGFEPLFPRYVLFQPTRLGQSLCTVRRSGSVVSIVRLNGEYAVLRPDVVEAIQEWEEQHAQWHFDPVHYQRSDWRLGAPGRHTAVSLLEELTHSVSIRRIFILMELLGQTRTAKPKPS